MKLKGITAFKNIGYMTLAQMIVMLFSVAMSLFVPKILGITAFSFWQLFIFYASYTGCLHLGLNDGIYLKMGGKVLSADQKKSISSQLWLSMLIQLFVVILIFMCLYFTTENQSRIDVYAYVALYALVNNIFNYCGSTLQSTNKIKGYAVCLMIDKIVAIAIIVALVVCKVQDFRWYVVAYLFGRLLATILLLVKFRDIFLNSFSIGQNVIRAIVSNIKVGYNLMIANIIGSFILGVGRFVIDINYPIEVFGIISFSFTLTGFILALISQVGNSVFPVLATKDMEFHKTVFPNLERLMECLLPLSFLAYPFIWLLIQYYLPQYSDSLIYFVLLLPLCVFETKSSVLYYTYMKVLRKEKALLRINILSLIISGGLVLISCYVFKEIQLIVSSLVVAEILKALLLANCIKRTFNIDAPYLSMDVLLSVLCVLVLACIHSAMISIGISSIIVIAYTLIRKKSIKESFTKVFVHQ